MKNYDYYEKVRAWRARKGFDWGLFASALAKLQPKFDRNLPFYLLDVGCNDGEVQTRIRKRYPKAVVKGVDSNIVAVTKAQEQGRNVVLTGKILMNQHLDFDVVTCYSVIAHMEFQRHQLGMMYAHLRPGGVLLIETPDPMYDRLLAVRHAITGYKSDPTIQKVLSPEQLKAMLPASAELVLYRRTGYPLPWYLPFPTKSDYAMVFRKPTRKA